MPRRAKPLSAVGLRQLGIGRHFDGDGLVLLVRSPEIAFWEYWYSLNSKRRVMGLGRARGRYAVGLAEAREKVGELRRLVKSGIDPLAQRDAEKATVKAAAQQAVIETITFRAVAQQYIVAHESGWRNDKTRQQFENSLRDHVFPHFGDISVAKVDTAHVMAVLEPLWKEKVETASRVRGRIENVLDYAKARGWRDSENPARWKGHIANMLPRRSKVRKVVHHAALPWTEVGAFMVKLREQQGVAAKALEFTILTAARSGETRGAKWSEIDFNSKTWTVPESRMKSGREHRVPLSDDALTVLRAMPQDEDLIFFGRSTKPLSDMSLLAVLRRMKVEVSVHGFRSTFRDWVAESTNYPAEVAEAALAHMVSDRTVAAYQRGDLFEKRRKLMDAWASFCTTPYMADAKVVPLVR